MDIKGFQFAAVEAAIKKQGRKDLALIFSEVPATAVAVFTTNAVKAAPVLLSAERIKSCRAQALVVNSGNANACTGEQGMRAARETSRQVAEGLGIPDEAVQVSSTGVIGVQLPMDRMRAAIPALVDGLTSGTLDDVAEAIMTTDTFPKMEARSGQAGGVTYTVAGIAKGAGMIMPNMATMLSFIITDAAVEAPALDQIFPPRSGDIIQCHYRGRRHVHERYLPGAGQRHGGKSGHCGGNAGGAGVRGPIAGGAALIGPTDRQGWRRRHEIRGDPGRRGQERCRRQAGGNGYRQFQPGKDRFFRPGRQLGPYFCRCGFIRRRGGPDAPLPQL